MKHSYRTVWAIAMIAPALIATAPSALAGPPAPSSKPAGVAPAASPVLGYQQVYGDDMGDNGGTQVEAEVSCPGNTYAVGGGAVFDNENIFENLKSSYPIEGGTVWSVVVTNASNRADSFQAYATCVDKFSHYKIVQGAAVDNPPGAQTLAQAVCPSGTVSVGGGAIGSGFVDVNLNTSAPTTGGWIAYLNNASNSDASVSAVAICGSKPKGYSLSYGSQTEIEPFGQSDEEVSCPTNRVSLGGGGVATSDSTSVNLNSSTANGPGGWVASEDNDTDAATEGFAATFCAKAKG